MHHYRRVRLVNTANENENENENSALALMRLRRMCESGEARAIRERSHLSQAEEADGVPCARATLAAWETCRRVPRGEAALRYFDLLLRLKAEGRVSPLKVA